MKLNRIKLSVILISLLVTTNDYSFSSTFNKEQAVETVEKAFEAQVSLSEKPRPMEQINQRLEVFFTDEFKASFIEENVIEMENGYITLGTDFAPYYIPFFHYNDKTKAAFIKGKWYVWERRTGKENGPFSMEEGVEAVVLTKQDGEWKVAEITYDLPEKIDTE